MKQQRILLFSDRQRPAAELPLRRGARYQLTHCARGDQGIDAVSKMQQRFDWILFDGALMDGEQKEIVRSLRAMGLLFPESCKGACDTPSCKVEWDANGILQLHCSRQAGCVDFQSDQHGDHAEGFIFEYHAPMKRTG
jgi:hypothetical protein